MAITVYLLGHKCDVLAIEDAPLAELVYDAQMHWNEDAEPQALAFLDETGRTLVMLMRDQDYPEICHSLYINGHRETHRCRYVTDAQGYYQHTEITLLWSDDRYTLAEHVRIRNDTRGVRYASK